MIKSTPSLGRLAAMTLFALSCFAVLTFLWTSFGGTVPLKAKGYRFDVAFPKGGQLAQNADVRIAGITVGHVAKIGVDPRGNHTLATVELDPKFAPVHVDSRAVLRTKTLGGETYMEITPGTRGAPMLKDGARLPEGQVTDQVQLEDILNAFDPKTRKAFSSWQRDLGAAINGRGEQLNNAIGNFPQLATNATDVLQVLDSQQHAVQQLVKNGGTVFRALSRNRASLHGLIVNSGQLFQATADERGALSDSFAIFPTFLSETRTTQTRLERFSVEADPLVRDLQPVMRDLRPTLHSARLLAPDLRRLFVNLDPLITASQRGLPALRKTLEQTQPLLQSLGPFLSQLNPILEFLQQYQHVTTDFFSQGVQALNATTTTSTPGSAGHFLRQVSPSGPESVTVYRDRLPTDRGNSYYTPLGLSEPPAKLGQFLIPPEWDCNNTGAAGDGSLPPKEGGTDAAPGCWVQPNIPFQGHNTHFPFVRPDTYRSGR